MALKNKVPLTEALLEKLSKMEPLFSMSSGAAMELFGHNPLRKAKRMSEYTKDKMKRERKRIQKAFDNLIQANLVTEVGGKNGKYRITPKGWMRYAVMYGKHFKKKDTEKRGKGYIIIFDIPEKHRNFRDIFRRVLYSLGFTQLQRSVFLTYDHAAFEFAARVVANCDLEERVRFVFAEKVV